MNKSFLISAFLPVVLAGCVSEVATSSSSQTNSSAVLQSSSSEAMISSSQRSSSSAAVSSQAQSSTASAASCDVDIAKGQAIYNAADFSCSTCHGATNGSAMTPGVGANPSISILDAPYGAIGAGKPSETTLDLYIEKHMSAFFGTSCTGTVASCSADVAAYLYDSAGQDWCAQASSSEQTQSSVANSSSSAAPVVNSPIHSVTVLAVNTGGPEVDVGHVFKADTGFTNGKISDATTSGRDIDNTEEDALFLSERWGESSYAFNLYNGTFNIEFGFAEFVTTHTEGSRVFDVSVEGQLVLNDMDIVKEAGAVERAIVKEIKGIKIEDGELNIDFKAVQHNPTISYIKVTRQEWPGEQYDRLCSSCHGGPNGENSSKLGGPLVASECDVCGNKTALESFIDSTMPFKFPEACTGSCATRIADYIHRKFAGYGDNPSVDLPPFLDERGDVAACNSLDTEFNHLRRVASVDYNNMVADLFAVSGSFTDAFSADQLVGNFFINTSSSADPGQVKQYFEAATKVAELAITQQAQWMPCSERTYACAKTMVENLGRRAFRRPLTDAEVNRLMSGFSQVRQGSENSDIGFDRGLSVLVQGLLTSPQFLYYVEQGEGSGEVVPLTQYEMAARLALFLWRSLPDDALLNAAANNQLKTDAELKAQAERMLADGKAKRAGALFHREWMKVKYPQQGINAYSQQVAAVVDFNRTVNALIFDENASVGDLFTVNYGFLNQHTKTLYGVTSEPIAAGSNGYDKYLLGQGQRGGLLARTPFLRNNPTATTRGVFLREHILCGVIPAPPPNAAEKIPVADNTTTPRELFALHTIDPGCGGCHVLMDPLGFPFDHYDSEGMWRERYPGNADVPGGFDIDDSGNFLLTDIDGDFEGARELQDRLALSDDVKACYSYHWFEFALGRKASTRDNCSLGEINQNANAAGGSIKDVITAIVLSDAFRHRRNAP